MHLIREKRSRHGETSSKIHNLNKLPITAGVGLEENVSKKQQTRLIFSKFIKMIDHPSTHFFELNRAVIIRTICKAITKIVYLRFPFI